MVVGDSSLSTDRSSGNERVFRWTLRSLRSRENAQGYGREDRGWRSFFYMLLRPFFHIAWPILLRSFISTERGIQFNTKEILLQIRDDFYELYDKRGVLKQNKSNLGCVI